MKVNPILAGISFRGDTSAKNRRMNKYNWIPITGYASLGCGITSGIFGYRKNIVVHKVAAMVAFAAAAAHILLLKTMHGIGKKHQ